MKKISLLIFVFLIQSCHITNNGKNRVQIFPLTNYAQNLNYYIDPKSNDYNSPLLQNAIQQEKVDAYKERFFGEQSPWAKEFVINAINKPSPKDILSIENLLLEKFKAECDTKHPKSFSFNFRPYTCAWFENKIKPNLNLTQFNKYLDFNPENRAIAVENISARSLPTNSPLYFNYNQVGEGYPFDKLQITSIWLGTPLYIVGKSKDKKWSLILTNSDIVTWVPSYSIARVSCEFIERYKKIVVKNGLRVIIQPETPIKNNLGKIVNIGYTGSLYPGQYLNNINKIFYPVMLKNGYAKLKVAKINQGKIAFFPLVATPKNFVNVINPLLGRPYGWGGLYFFNDCSLELKAIFSTFGIWLPRNSAEQSKEGVMLNLSSLGTQERLEALAKYGRKFLTLVYIQGHIMLYIGNYNNTPWIHNNIWGFRPEDNSYRSIIGQSSLMPLLKYYPENPELISIANDKYRDKFIITYLDEKF
ncbi:SH3 domain-containing protein [Fluviispira vulneris]|uniref:SH3 domain-containing protein n=1 Tax=Fluviispira vulneris TaxID=2763012 RepID=UPI001646BA56|nr:SH3 domain-containing protein [Fluviispira vulneris]